MNTTLFKKWAPVILSAAVTLIAGFQTLVQGAHGPTEIVQFLTLVATTVTTGVVPLLDTRWQGVLKTGIEVVGVVIVAILPFWLDGGVNWSNGMLILVAILKALATHFGVVLRTSTLIDARAPEGDVPVITTLAPATTTTVFQQIDTVGAGEAEQSGTVDDAPKHLATS